MSIVDSSAGPGDLDAGERAREAVGKRLMRYNWLRKIKIVAACVVALIFLCVGGVSYHTYNLYKKNQTYTSVERQCSVTVGDMTFSGTRVYSYPYSDVYGFHFRDNSMVKEETRLRIRGKAVTVISQVFDGSKAPTGYRIDEGERYDQFLERGDSYTFVTKNGFAVVAYEDFCKVSPPQEAVTAVGVTE